MNCLHPKRYLVSDIITFLLWGLASWSLKAEESFFCPYVVSALVVHFTLGGACDLRFDHGHYQPEFVYGELHMRIDPIRWAVHGVWARNATDGLVVSMF